MRSKISKDQRRRGREFDSPSSDGGRQSWRSYPASFGTDDRPTSLSAAADPPERLRAAVDFEVLRADLEAELYRGDRSRGDRPLYDALAMFRILVAQTLYTLSDDQASIGCATVSRSGASPGSRST